MERERERGRGVEDGSIQSQSGSFACANKSKLNASLFHQTDISKNQFHSINSRLIQVKAKAHFKKNAHFIVRVLKKKNRLLCVMRRQRRVVSTLSLSAHVSDNNLRIKEQKKKK